jgi:hypothetical protein
LQLVLPDARPYVAREASTNMDPKTTNDVQGEGGRLEVVGG